VDSNIPALILWQEVALIGCAVALIAAAASYQQTANLSPDTTIERLATPGVTDAAVNSLADSVLSAELSGVN